MRLELHHLRTLGAIAEHGSVTKAAAALSISQPALSTQLQRIERCLGGPVFHRGVHGIAVTAFGEFVLARVRGALANVDDLLAGSTSAPTTPTRLSLGVIEGPLMVGLLGALEDLLPGCLVTVHSEYSTSLLLELVASRRIDVALVADHPGYERRGPHEVIVRSIVDDPGFVALSSGHRLAAATEVDLRDLAEDAWIVPPSDGTGWPEHMLDACRAAGFTPRVAHSVVDNRLQLNLIGSGRAVAIVQGTTRSTSDMVVRPIIGDPLWMRYQLAWHRDGPLRALGDRLVACAAEVYHDSATSPEYQAWQARRNAALSG